MTDWKAKLKEAKELLDMGIMMPEEFEGIKKTAYAEMGFIAKEQTTTPLANENQKKSDPKVFSDKPSQPGTNHFVASYGQISPKLENKTPSKTNTSSPKKRVESPKINTKKMAKKPSKKAKKTKSNETDNLMFYILMAGVIGFVLAVCAP